ncbi:MAG: hypothetical protein QOH99_587, partial [Frankiaceae bacterium]|nr:hypothetical protein [Frankiaceae bacterium]
MSPAARAAATASASTAASTADASRAARVSPTRPVPHHELPHRSQPAPLAVVRTRPGPARAPFVILIAALVVGGLVGLLLLNTALTQGAFERKAVSREVKKLIETQQGLREHIAAVQEPGALAVRARQLGLVASTCPVFLRLPAVTVLGTPCPAKAPPKPVKKPATVVAADGKTPVGGQTGTTVQGQSGTAAGTTKAGTTKAGTTKAGTTTGHAKTTPAKATPVKTTPVTTA